MINQEVLAGMAEMDGERFVQSAVQNILLREAGPAEQANLTEKLQQGIAREKLVYLLRLSEEGMAAETEIRDLRVKEISLNEIFCHENLAFQTAAYLAALGRTPEGEAAEDFERSLRAGNIVKIEYLHALVSSAEGRAWGSRISGMTKAWGKRQLKESMKNLPGMRRVWANVQGVRQALRVLGIREQEMQAQMDIGQRELLNRVSQLEAELAYFQSRGEAPDLRRMTEAEAPEEEKNRLRKYDEVYQRVLSRAGERPFALALACGQGEMLELLQQEYGFAALGVESNEILLAACEKKGLNAVRQRITAYIRNAESESIDMIFLSRGAEHLPAEAFEAMLVECRRALCPGGALIVERMPQMSSAMIETMVEDAGFSERETISAQEDADCAVIAYR